MGNITLAQYFKFLKALFGETRVEFRYEKCVDKLSEEDRVELVNTIDTYISRFEEDERNKNHAFYLKGYYFNPVIDYEGMGYNEANQFLLDKVNRDCKDKEKKGLVEILEFRKRAVIEFGIFYKHTLENKLNKIFTEYNPMLKNIIQNRNESRANKEITLAPLKHKNHPIRHKNQNLFMHNKVF